MIETLQQAQDAVKEIKKLTGWKLNKIAVKCSLPHHTIKGIDDGSIQHPRESTMQRINKVLLRVRKI